MTYLFWKIFICNPYLTKVFYWYVLPVCDRTVCQIYFYSIVNLLHQKKKKTFICCLLVYYVMLFVDYVNTRMQREPYVNMQCCAYKCRSNIKCITFFHWMLSLSASCISKNWKTALHESLAFPCSIAVTLFSYLEVVC